MINGYNKAKRILSDIQVENKVEGKVVVINTVRSIPYILHQEFFIAWLLAKSGAQVKLLLDDGILDHWDTFQVHHQSTILNPLKSIKSRINLTYNRFLIRKLYKHKNINVLKYSEFSIGYNDIKLSESDMNHIISSIRRYFENGDYDKTNSEHRKHYEYCSNSCKITKNIGINVFKEFNPDLFITSHGIYSTWGPMYYQMKELGVKSLIYGTHVYMPHHIYITDTLMQTLSDDSDWVSFSKRDGINIEEKEQCISLLENRVNRKSKDNNFYYDSNNKFDKIEIDKNDGEYVFGVFPNIIWDGDVIERDTIFNGIINWLEETIEVFRNSKHKLVFRFHPAEQTLWKGSLSVEDALNERVPDLKEMKNIYLISSAAKIDTYSFILDNVDIGLMYDGILTVEMTYLGKPVISCAKSRFNGAGFTFEPKSKEEYYEMLMNPENLVTDFNQNLKSTKEQLYHYAYWYFFEAGYTFPIFSKKSFREIDLKSLTHELLSPIHNTEIRRTISKLTKYIE